MTTSANTQDGRMLRAEEPAEPLGDFPGGKSEPVHHMYETQM